MIIMGPIFGCTPEAMRRHLVNTLGEELADTAIRNRDAIRNIAAGRVELPQFDTRPRASRRREVSAGVNVAPFRDYCGPWDMESALAFGRRVRAAWPRPSALLGKLPIEFEELRRPYIEDYGNGQRSIGRSFLPPNDRPKIQIANLDAAVREFAIGHEICHHAFPHLSSNRFTAGTAEDFCSLVAAAWLGCTVTE